MVGEGSTLRMQQGAVSSSDLSLASPIWVIQAFSAEEAW